MSDTISAWSGMVPVDDTELWVTDSGGSGPVVVYLNGSFAGMKYWKYVIAGLGDGYRHICFDERGRGKSKTSKDYSFEACIRSLDAVLKARDVEEPVLVGWSYGAPTGVFWGDRNPAKIVGVVAIDGAVPFGITGPEAQARIRKLFGRMRPMMWILRPLGLAARMSAAQHADVSIENNEINAGIGPMLEGAAFQVRYVLATGGNIGSSTEEMEQVRASIEPVLAKNANLKISAKVPTGHGKILTGGAGAIGDAVREIAGANADEQD
ncbi:alpha/beta fold hydrolase [Streptacidiphilus sp. MAP5-52]|uniref:alpha/beta fold hydrolase n=1 Tax=Streptacidiphilus sp. MAP5-52 TaxID=3156267 RepID=UPI0035129139